MTTYALQWAATHDDPQQTMMIEAPAPASDLPPHQYDALARVILDRFTPRVKKPWTRPVRVTVIESYGVKEGVTQGCGYFQVVGKKTITGTWWEVEL